MRVRGKWVIHETSVDVRFSFQYKKKQKKKEKCEEHKCSFGFHFTFCNNEFNKKYIIQSIDKDSMRMCQNILLFSLLMIVNRALDEFGEIHPQSRCPICGCLVYPLLCCRRRTTWLSDPNHEHTLFGGFCTFQDDRSLWKLEFVDKLQICRYKLRALLSDIVSSRSRRHRRLSDSILYICHKHPPSRICSIFRKWSTTNWLYWIRGFCSHRRRNERRLNKTINRK